VSQYSTFTSFAPYVIPQGDEIAATAQCWLGSLESGSLLDRLQSVLNATARLIFSARRSEHAWLHFSVTFTGCKSRKDSSSVSCVLTHHCLHGTAPPYLDETLQPRPPRGRAPTDFRHVHTSSSSLCRYANSWSSRRPIDPPDNTRRSSVSCGCCTRLERSSLFTKSCSVTDVLQAPP